MSEFKNPLPVAILLQKAINHETGAVGIVLGRRAIEPKIGQWALIGGHMETKDKDVEAAAAREFLEETGVRPLFNKPHLFYTYCDGKYVLLFLVTDYALSVKSFEYFQPNSECSEIRVAWKPERLAFPSHTVALTKFFDGI